MPELDVYSRFLLLSSATAGAGVSGVILLLLNPRGWGGRVAACLAGLACAYASAAMLLPECAGLVAAVGGAATALVALMSLGQAQRALGACLKPLLGLRAAGLAVTVTAASLWTFEALRYDTAVAAMADVPSPGETTRPPTSTTDWLATTDRGTPIPLEWAPELAGPDGGRTDSPPSTRGLVPTPDAISRGPASDEPNCHGWVFTGGGYLMFGRHVDTILAENGYERVTSPVPGDLCVYRTPEGTVSHTAAVRAVLADGAVLVEGKWGSTSPWSKDRCAVATFPSTGVPGSVTFS